MKYFFSVLVTAVFAAMMPHSAYALIDHTWISATGTGTACTRTAPCGSFATAHDATNAGGVVSVLDSGDFGSFTITKSITIRAEGSDAGFTLKADAGNFYTFAISAGPDDVVVLEGLHLHGASIGFNTAAHLHIINCVISNETFGGFNGIRFAPSGFSRLSVTDTQILHFGGDNRGAGILILPNGSNGAALIQLERVTINGNVFGVAVDGSVGVGGVNMTISDSMIGGNTQDGIVATTTAGHSPIGVMIKNSRSVNNAIGVRSIGPNVIVRVSGSTITGNGTGLSFLNGGALLSFNNNEVEANGANGSFSGSIAQK